MIWLTFQAMLKQQFLLLARYPANLLANFFLVLVSVMIVTLVMMIFAPAGLGEQLRGVTLYGFVIYIFLSHTIWTVGLTIQREKVEGTLTALYLAPAPRFLTLLARSLTTLAWTSLAGLLGLLIAQGITGPLPIHRPGLALLILCFTLSSLVGLGFALAGLALRYGESIELFANILEFGLMGLCAFFFPFALLPAGLRQVARLVPLSYAVDAFRTVALGESRPELLSLEAEITIVMVSGVVSPVLGYIIYRINEQIIRRQGLI